MKNTEFLKLLSESLNKGEICSEEVFGKLGGSIGTVPRIFGNIDGYLVKFDFLSYNEVKLEVDMKPQHYLYLGHYNMFTKFLKKLNLSNNVKQKDPKFNEDYYLRNVKAENAERTLSQQNIEIIRKFEPFDYFEQTFKEYRLLKDINEEYTPSKAYDELKLLVQYVKNCDKEWGTERKLIIKEI